MWDCQRLEDPIEPSTPSHPTSGTTGSISFHVLVPVHETNSDTLKINRCSNRILEIFLIFFTWLIYYKNNMQLVLHLAKIWNRIVEINHYIYVLHDYILYGKIWNLSRWEENKNTYKQWCDTVRVKKNILFFSRNLNEIAFRSVSCKWQFHSVERKRVVRDPFESLVSGLHRA